MRAAGCTWEPEGNFEVMRSPVGTDEWACRYTRARAKEALEVYAELAKLGDPRCAVYLARYLAGRANYIWRTAPRTQCVDALVAVDACVRALVQDWVGNGDTLGTSHLRWMLQGL